VSTAVIPDPDPRRTRRFGAGAIAAVVALAAIAAGVSLLGGGEDERADAQTYRVAAVFDVARGIGPRQVVKIAGARVGEVTAVHLTKDFKARVEMKVDRRFAPFRADARCAIKPEGLITENFVECDPGHRGELDGAIPVSRTAAPVTLQNLFEVFDVPTTQRIAVLLNELGMSTAGRGEDLNEIVYRANPTLAAARDAIAVVDRQKAQLTELLDAADPVLAKLAERDEDVKRFLTDTADLTSTTARHRGALSEAIARLPPLLAATKPALEQLGEVADDAPATLRALRASAPALTDLTRDVPTFSDTATASLKTLDPVLRDARTTLRRATPITKQLGVFAANADPAGNGIMRLLWSLRESGGIDNLWRAYYLAAGASNRFDARGHYLTANGTLSGCSVYSSVKVGGCDGILDGKDEFGNDEKPTGEGQAQPAKARERSAPKPREERAQPQPRQGEQPAPTPTTPLPVPAKPKQPLPVPLPPIELPQDPVQPAAETVEDLLDFLLK
jgi:virulence factor Mce-like protein